MSQEPKLTIIIPTCDRADTLRHSLATVLCQPQPEIEIIVSDNAGGPETRRLVEAIDDPRLRYLRVDERLGMSEHWEFALGHARGEWVTMLGDDDGFLPGGVARFLETAGKYDVDAISSVTCVFSWPKNQGVDKGDLLVRGGTGFEIIESAPVLEKCLHNKYTYKSLPWIYTGGFVKRSVIAHIISRTGCFFKSIIPDVYSGIAVASCLTNYGRSHVPFAIEGTSRHSNGALCFSESRKNGKIPKFFSEGTMRFHPSLGDGFVPTFPLLVYESFLQSELLRDRPLGSGIEEQLEIALLAAKKKQWGDTVDYCQWVAEMNGVDLAPIQRKVAIRRLHSRARKIMRQLIPSHRKTENEIARVRDRSIINIHDAAERAENIMLEKLKS